mgnify:CR=1 FL=1
MKRNRSLPKKRDKIEAEEAIVGIEIESKTKMKVKSNFLFI